MQSLCSLYFSDVKNKLCIHRVDGSSVQSAWCCAGHCVGEWAGPSWHYSAPGLERKVMASYCGLPCFVLECYGMPPKGTATQEKHFAQVSGRDVAHSQFLSF